MKKETLQLVGIVLDALVIILLVVSGCLNLASLFGARPRGVDEITRAGFIAWAMMSACCVMLLISLITSIRGNRKLLRVGSELCAANERLLAADAELKRANEALMAADAELKRAADEVYARWQQALSENAQLRAQGGNR